ncbi:shadow of prion protein-like [Polyodon spathula]|uniref:shadow of prion protein-like n=1 Tax=Polyodon spathula TaxID=7913 RepID=UPI001B7F5533|nr:shadow of prion protein-like [Polyodon spathula]XP_041089281.1 shadow of prion protein-like [Polyodon spathula]XP_041089283.1 shadow of prion protein-like [Polyodon spathula]
MRCNGVLALTWASLLILATLTPVVQSRGGRGGFRGGGLRGRFGGGYKPMAPPPGGQHINHGSSNSGMKMAGAVAVGAVAGAAMGYGLGSGLGSMGRPRFHQRYGDDFSEEDQRGYYPDPMNGNRSMMLYEDQYRNEAGQHTASVSSLLGSLTLGLLGTWMKA